MRKQIDSEQTGLFLRILQTADGREVKSGSRNPGRRRCNKSGFTHAACSVVLEVEAEESVWRSRTENSCVCHP